MAPDFRPFVLACLLVVAACARPASRAAPAPAAAPTPAAAPAQLASAQLASARLAPLPNVVLRTQDGRAVRFYDDLVRGKVVLINFMFTSCESLCPRTTRNLVKVQALLGERLGRDVQMISISVDPERDTPAALKRYAEEAQARPGWDFVTGDADDIALLRRRLGVYEKDAAQDQDRNQHTGMLIYGNEATGRWSKLYAMAAPEQIVASVTRWISH